MKIRHNIHCENARKNVYKFFNAKYFILIMCSVTFLLILLVVGLLYKNEALADSPERNKSLILVQTLFRHGDRTSGGSEEYYPKDPYINETFQPYGLAELTNAGKKKMYRLGELLRARYGDFLGDLYRSDILYALSTDKDRTKMSLQLVLAGLFPPSGDNVWKDGYCWQPIPFHISSEDSYFRRAYCPTTEKLKAEFLNKREEKEKIKQYEQIFKFISDNSGANVTSYVNAADLFFILQPELEFGLTLPTWTQTVFPTPMYNFTIKDYYDSTATEDMLRISAGPFIQKLLDDIVNKVNGSSMSQGIKIYLYSAHEIDVVVLLRALGAYEPHIPPYGACVFLELHKIDQVYGLKIYYEDYKENGPKLLKMPNCDTFCPLDQFAEQIRKYLPKPGDRCQL